MVSGDDSINTPHAHERAGHSPIDSPIDSANPWRTIQDEPGCLNAAY